MTGKRQSRVERQSLLQNFCGSRKMVKGWLRKFLFLLSLIIFLSMILAPLSVSAKTCEQWVAKAVSVEGKVEAKRDGETQWQQVQPDETFCAGDQIRTKVA